MYKNKGNQFPKGIKWSAVPLPYFSLLAFGKQGSSPDKGQSPVEWGDFPYVHLPACPLPPLSHPARPGTQPARAEA